MIKFRDAIDDLLEADSDSLDNAKREFLLAATVCDPAELQAVLLDFQGES